MRRIYEAFAQIQGEGAEHLVMRYDNRGEPFRKGISLTLYESAYTPAASVFLEDREAIELRNELLKAYPL